MGLSGTTRNRGRFREPSPARHLAWWLVVAAMGFSFTGAGFSQTSATISNAHKVAQPVQEAGPSTTGKSSETSKKEKEEKSSATRLDCSCADSDFQPRHRFGAGTSCGIHFPAQPEG